MDDDRPCLPKHELFLKTNRKSITLFNVAVVESEPAVEIEPSVEIEPAVLIEPF